ncbi:MAG: hypothetical protein RIQ53_2251 [Pseudomonadota bacterium]|jgi:hypothetical protein
MLKLQLIPSWVKWTAVVAALACLAAVIGTQRIQLAAERLKTTQVREAWATERADQERAAREATQEGQRLMSRWHARQMESYRAKAEENARNERLAADLRGQLDRLHSDVSAFAAGRHQAAADSIAACRADAATLGELLEGALRADAAHARAAEQHATDVRALLGEWPVNAP